MSVRNCAQRCKFTLRFTSAFGQKKKCKNSFQTAICKHRTGMRNYNMYHSRIIQTDGWLKELHHNAIQTSANSIKKTWAAAVKSLSCISKLLHYIICQLFVSVISIDQNVWTSWQSLVNSFSAGKTLEGLIQVIAFYYCEEVDRESVCTPVLSLLLAGRGNSIQCGLKHE